MRFNISGVPSVAIKDYQSLPQVSAVYLAVDLDKRVHYVGSAKNLWKRWKAHHKGIDIALIPGVRIYWLEESRLSKPLIESEVELIKEYCPPLNTTNRPDQTSFEKEFSKVIADRDFPEVINWVDQAGGRSVLSAVDLLMPKYFRPALTPLISEGNLLPTLQAKGFPSDVAMAIYKKVKDGNA